MKRSSVVFAVGVFAVILLVAAGLAWYKHRADKAAAAAGGGYVPVEAVEVTEARQIEWRPTADLVGTVFSLRSVRVSNEVAGAVKRVGFESGAVVEEGQVLLELDDSAERADLAAAEAAVRVAEANVGVAEARMRLAETEFQRMNSVSEARAVAVMELDRTRSELESAKADHQRMLAEVDQARARVEQARTRLEKMVVKAPFKGRAGLKMIHEGQYLAEGTPVVALEEVSDRIYLDFAIPQEYLPRVYPGLSVMATGDVLGDEPVRIEVVAIDATVNNETRNVRIRGIVDNEDQRLRAGMFVQIRVPVDAPKPYVAVPSTAIRRTAYADQVFVIEPAEAPEGVPAQPGQLWARQRFVRLGPVVGEQVIVLEGINAGEKVAATGSFKLHDKALVMAVPPGGSPPQGAPAAPGGDEQTDGAPHASK